MVEVIVAGPCWSSLVGLMAEVAFGMLRYTVPTACLAVFTNAAALATAAIGGKATAATEKPTRPPTNLRAAMPRFERLRWFSLLMPFTTLTYIIADFGGESKDFTGI